MSDKKTATKKTVRSSSAKGQSKRKVTPASKAWGTIHSKLKKDPKFAKQFHAKASAGSSKAWVTIHKLRALALSAAKAGKGKPKTEINGYTVTDKQYSDAVAKVKAARKAA